MEGAKFIESIRLENILSFGPNSEPFPLEPLNVFIGPNASGKSNFISALELLHSAPKDLQEPIRRGGGVSEWLWKGVDRPTATIDMTIRHRGRPRSKHLPLRHSISFISDLEGRFWMIGETVEDAQSSDASEEKPNFYYRNQLFSRVLRSIPSVSNQIAALLRPESVERVEQNLGASDLESNQSILSQRRDPLAYPELHHLDKLLGDMSFYREINVGPHTPPRLPQGIDLRRDRLLEDVSNLNLVLDGLLNQPLVKQQILERMKAFYSSFRDMLTSINVDTRTVQLFFHEGRLREAVPSARLSDGSLRYLCLLAVLCHPTPPSIICIEEPETGLHPDIISKVADLLVEASQRSQIFVTTHSDVLVDALTDIPDAVVVCEKVDGATQVRRLDAGKLKPWLEKYRLGELWTSGEIGGNRW